MADPKPDDRDTRPLRTLHLDTERGWRGGEQQALYLAKGLAARGHVAELVGLEGEEFVRRGREAGIPVHEGRLRGELNPLAISTVTALLTRGRFDLIHCHTAHAHTIGAIAARLAGRLPCLVSRRVDFPVKRGLFGVKLVKYRRGVTHYLAISSAVERELLAAGVAARRISRVPSGIDPTRHANADPQLLEREFGVAPDAPVIGAVGHFAWHKGFEVLIDAAPRLLERFPRLRFFLLGDGELAAQLNARIDSAGERTRAAFLLPGFRDDVASFVARADAFAAPSLLEGLNTSILDALWLARPVVASNVGGIPDAIEHEVTGLLVPPDDPSALAAALERVLSNRELGAALGRSGRARVEDRFTVDAMVDRTLAVYRRAVRADER